MNQLVEEIERKNSEQNHSLISNNPGMVYEARADGSVIIISGLEEICGYTIPEFASQELNWFSIIHPHDKDRFYKEGLLLTEKPGSIVQEYRIIAKDGSIRWVRDRKSSSFTEDGLFDRINGIVMDIPQRKSAEDDLKESEHFFRALFEQAAIGVAQIETATGRFLRVNQCYCDILGYTHAEMNQLTFQEITYPDDLQLDLDNLKLLKAGSIREFTMEKRYFRKDGSIVWVNLTVSPMWAPGELPEYHIAVVEDITQRKQTDNDLRKFSRAVEQSVSSVMITDANGLIEFVNPTFTRLSGYSAAEVIGKNPNISKSGKTSAEEYGKLWQIITSGNEWKGELLNRRKDGQLYWVSASISPIRNSFGVITHFLAIQEDITERKRIEEQLSRQKNYLSALHEISLGILSRLELDDLLLNLVLRAGQVLQTQNGCILLVDKPGNELECKFGTGTLNKYVGIRIKPNEGMAGKVWMTARPLVTEDYEAWEGRSSQIGPKDVRSVIGVPLLSGSQAIGVLILAYGWDSDRVFSMDEVELLERLANLASISIENARLFDETQRLFKTEQQRAAELAIMVKASEAVAKNIGLKELSRIVGDLITNIFNTDATSILLLDPQTQMIQPLYEFDMGEYIENVQPFPLGQGLTSEVIQTRQPLLIGTAEEAAQHGAYYPPEAQILNPSITQSYLGVPILVSNQILGVLAIHSYSRNVFDHKSARLLSALSSTIGSAIENARLYSEMEKAREAAESANAAKSIFLASISHELRTPLNAILGFAQLLRRDSNLTPEQHEYLEIINRRGINLLDLINDVLEISKIESGRTILRENDFDLYQMFDSLAEMYTLQAKEKGLGFGFAFSEALPQHVRTDNLKLWHTLSNLISNSIKFTRSGSVSVRVSPLVSSGDLVTIQFEVEDTGPGIAPEELEVIFVPFVQAHAGQQTQEGVGLGLSICKQYVRLLGGDLQVRSELGVGSRFEFAIQVHKVDPVGANIFKPPRRVVGLDPNQKPPHGGSYRLLIAEDDESNRLLLVNAFKPLGFNIREAVNGQEAVDIWARWKPDLILMDMYMPVLDGFSATKQIKATPKGKSSVIIALTASSFEEDRERILSTGCDDFVRKPFRLDEIYEVVTRHLGVKFIYQEPEILDPARSTETGIQSGAPLEPLDLSSVAESLLEELRKATVLADIKQMILVIEKINDQNPQAAKTLEKLVNSFEYRRILSVIDQAGEK